MRKITFAVIALVIAIVGTVSVFWLAAYKFDQKQNEQVNPFLAPPSQYESYPHWKCPDGYVMRFGGFSGRKISCQNRNDFNKEMEAYERSLQPEGK